MEVKIYQGLKLLFSTLNATAITIKLKEAGEVTVLNDHISLLGEVIPGKITIKISGSKRTFVLQNGFFCFVANKAKIITAALKDEILPI